MGISDKRIGIIAEITKEYPNVGKTALMKFLFLLQEVYGVPLGYDFEIYTYGPYSSEVMEEIDWARHQNIISMEAVCYSTGYNGYNFRISDRTDKVIEEEKEFILSYENAIGEMLSLFGGKSAKELELLTTIIYLYQIYEDNGWECNMKEISENVREIKPHFDISTINKEYSFLEDQVF